MSEYGASSCQGKRRHKSERRADESAKNTQADCGIPMKSYYCEFCCGWHVGSVRMQSSDYTTTSREQRKQSYTNSSKHERLDKFKFRKV